jgi:D-alanyl-lipoteichoic acid acyltransferase DltB (MBOAT superfamily)
MIVFTLSGVWHGGTLNYLVWGALHGFFLCLEKIFKRARIRIPSLLTGVLTYLLTTMLWAFFRLDLSNAVLILKKCVGFEKSPAYLATNPYYSAPLLFFTGLVFLEHAIQPLAVFENGTLQVRTDLKRQALIATLFIAGIIFSGKALKFIYFQY